MNKTTAIQLHLIEKGSITSWEAIKLYGATRLSAIIYKLRNRGMNIRTVSIETKDRYGNRCSYAKYILEDKNGKNKGKHKHDRKKRRLFKKAERV